MQDLLFLIHQFEQCIRNNVCITMQVLLVLMYSILYYSYILINDRYNSIMKRMKIIYPSNFDLKIELTFQYKKQSFSRFCPSKRSLLPFSLLVLHLSNIFLYYNVFQFRIFIFIDFYLSFFNISFREKGQKYPSTLVLFNFTLVIKIKLNLSLLVKIKLKLPLI